MLRFILTFFIIFATYPGVLLATELGVSVEFSNTDEATIRAYYREHQTGSESDHGKKPKGRTGLPPGIAKNLKQGKPLPPGIAKKGLPADLTKLLPPAPKGYERIAADGKVLLVEIATQVIHDVLEDIVLG